MDSHYRGRWNDLLNSSQTTPEIRDPSVLSDDELLHYISTSSSKCRQLYSELRNRQEQICDANQSSQEISTALNMEMIKLKAFYQPLQENPERRSVFVRTWLEDASCNCEPEELLEELFRKWLLLDNSVFLDGKLPPNKQFADISEYIPLVKFISSNIVAKTFTGFRGSTDLTQLKTRVEAQAGYKHPSKRFVLALFGASKHSHLLKCIPPKILCERISISIESYVEDVVEDGNPFNYKFNSQKYGMAWLRRTILTQDESILNNRVDLLCKIGQKFGEFLKKSNNCFGFNHEKCEYHPLNYQEEAIGSLYKICRFMPEDFTLNFKENVLKRLTFAAYPNINGNGNHRQSRLICYVSFVKSHMHIGGSDCT